LTVTFVADTRFVPAPDFVVPVETLLEASCAFLLTALDVIERASCALTVPIFIDSIILATILSHVIGKHAAHLLTARLHVSVSTRETSAIPAGHPVEFWAYLQDLRVSAKHCETTLALW
jgi:hypothetical protein